MFDLDSCINNLEKHDDYVLLEEDYKYFDELVLSITMNKSHIMYHGIVKQLYKGNPYTSIRNDVAWTVRKKIKFEKYIIEKFEGAERFNRYCREYRLEYVKDVVRISITDHHKNNLIFFRNGKSLDCYCFKNVKNMEVEFVAKIGNNIFEGAIINYLRYYLHIPELVYLSDYKIASILKSELTQGKMIENKVKAEGIKKISNSRREYCLAYISLPTPDINKPHPSWDLFTEQFQSKKDAKLFRAWIYSIFVEQDIGRQVLWLEGEGFSGKSTVASVLGEIMLSYNSDLFNSININRDNKIDLSNLDKARFLVFSNAVYSDFLQREEILLLTGNDYTKVKKLYQDPENKKLFTKIMVNSNYPPNYNATIMHERTRMIHVRLSPENIKAAKMKWYDYKEPFPDRLKKEFNNFLAHARVDYQHLLQKDGLLRV